MVEHGTENAGVGSSILPLATKLQCPECGTELGSQRSPIFCSECGARLNKSRRGLVVGTIVLLAAGGIGTAAVLNSSDGSSQAVASPTATMSRTSVPSPTVILAPASTPVPDGPGPPSSARLVEVTRVIDGDTIALSGLDVGRRDGRTTNRVARLIGIDTPELSGDDECFARESTEFTRSNLLARKVFVDFDVERLDRFGRALVYIWESEGAFFNGRLVAEGFALQATFPPNVRYVELFSRLVRDARKNDAGLWSRC